MKGEQIERLEALLEKRAEVKAAGESWNFRGTIEACYAFNSAAMDFMRDHGPALLQLARAVQTAATGEVIEVGDDEEGQPRVLIHSTRDELRKGPPLPFRTVALVPVPVKEGEG